MTSFSKIDISCHHCLYPGPELLAGPCHGVPLEAVHQLLNLLAQGVRSLLKTSINIQLRDAPHKTVHASAA